MLIQSKVYIYKFFNYLKNIQQKKNLPSQQLYLIKEKFNLLDI